MLKIAFGLAISICLALPIDATCWACKAVDGGKSADCSESDVVDRARSNCEGRTICALTCVKFCVTSGSNCTVRPPHDPGPFLDDEIALLSPSNAAHDIQDRLGSWSVAMLGSRTLYTRHAGENRGMISFEDGRSYTFHGWVDIFGDGVTKARYKLEGHPEIESVTVESPSRGADVFITVDYADGRRQHEIFGPE